MPENVETPRATSAATNLQEYRAAKAAPPAATTEAKPEEKKPEVSEQTAKAESGSAAAPEAPKQETQDKGKPKDRSAEGRAAELSAQGRYDEAAKILRDAKAKHDRDLSARDTEIAELRKKLENPQAPSKPAAEPGKPAATVDPTKPNFKAMLDDPKNKSRDYDDVHVEWEEKTYEWRKNKERAEADTKARTGKFNEKMDVARKLHSDFDAVLSGANYERTVRTLDGDVIGTVAHQLENGMDVLYHLGTEPDECRRIAALPPARQLIELGYISRDLATEAKSAATPPTTEKPQLVPHVSRTSAPPRSLGGLAPGEKSTKTPTTLAEHRANKAAK